MLNTIGKQVEPRSDTRMRLTALGKVHEGQLSADCSSWPAAAL